MTSKFELMLSDYCPQQAEEKQKLLKQKNTILWFIGGISVIFLAFIISMIITFHQNSTQLKYLIQKDCEIQQTINQINSSIFNKKLKLNNLLLTNLSLSYSKNLGKRIISLDITGNEKVFYISNWNLPDLEELLIDQKSQVSFENSYFPKLKNMSFPSRFEIINCTFALQYFPQSIKAISIKDSIFTNLTKIQIKGNQQNTSDSLLTVFQNNILPNVQQISIKNTTQYHIGINNYSPKLNSVIINDSLNVLIGVSLNNLPSLRFFQLTSYNYFTLTLKDLLIELDLTTLSIPRMSRLVLDNIKIKPITKQIKQVRSINIMNSQIQQLNLDYFFKLVDVEVINTTLKRLVSSLNNNNIKSMRVINTNIKEIRNNILNCEILMFQENELLTIFSNNSFFTTNLLILPSSIKQFQNNDLSTLTQLSVDTYNIQYTQLQLFNNNKVQHLYNLTLSNTKLSTIINNTFGFMHTFNISNSKFNDTGLLLVITNNTWAFPNTVEVIDISNNLIMDKDNVLSKYKEFFSKANITI